MRYLLGTLTEEERTVLEEQFLTDEQAFEELEIAEDELVDRYVRNELPATDRDRFKKMLISPRLAERVEVALLMAQRADAYNPAPAKIEPVSPSPKLPWWRKFFGPGPSGLVPAFMTTLAILLLVGAALIVLWLRLQHESQQLNAQRQEIQNLNQRLKDQEEQNRTLEARANETSTGNETIDRLSDEINRKLEQSRPQELLAAVVTQFLSPYNSERGPGGGGKPTPINITTTTRVVNLRLDVAHDPSYSRYQAEVQTLDKKPIRPCPNLKPVSKGDTKYINCVVLRSELTAGTTYNVHVDGLMDNGKPESYDDYLFQVIAR